MTEDKSKTRRNRAWYGKLDRDGFIHRSWMKNQGFPDHVFDGRPIIASATPGRNSRPAIRAFGIWPKGSSAVSGRRAVSLWNSR